MNSSARRFPAALVLCLWPAALGGESDAEKAAREGRFAIALEILRQASSEPGADARKIDEIRASVLESARKKRDEILAAGASLEARRQFAQALSLYERHVIDFPASREFAEMGRRIEDLRARLSREAEKKEGAGPSRYEIPDSAPAELRQRFEKGRALEMEGKFAEAQKHYREALGLSSDAISSHLLAGAIEDCQRQIWFFQAVRDAMEADPRRFEGLALGALEEVSAQDWPRLVARAGLDPYDACNAAVFLYRRGFEREADRLLAEAIAKDPSRQPLVDAILSRQRGEEVSSYGYVWHENRWMSFREREEFRFAGEIERHLALLDHAEEKTRREAWEKMLSLGESARAPLREGLLRRREAIVERLRAEGFLKKAGRIAERREELDRRRQFALEMIFDEEKYFYPYSPPECPPEKAKLYPAVQTEVDRRVAAVREIWESSEEVFLSAKTRRNLKELQDIEEFLERTGSRSSVLEPSARVLLGVDPEDEILRVKNFFWSRKERENLQDYNRRILAFNALAESSCSEEERRQIVLTNEYRALFGRRALAANEKLQKAARGHSREMAEKGYFSHFSPVPGRRTPFDRMKLEGYGEGAGENIASGSDAAGAHVGWIHSSGHHRNILMPFHREMGSGNHGSLWTQNFGRAKEYQENPAWVPR